MTGIHAFLADSLRWSHVPRATSIQVMAAGLGVGGPVMLGLATGQESLGMAAALGGLALSRGAQGASLTRRAASLLRAILTGCCAVAVGTTIGRLGWTEVVAVAAIGGITALFSGVSRAMVVTAAQFILFVIIATRLGAQGAPVAGTTLVFAAGALWTGAVWLLLDSSFSIGDGASAPVVPLRARLRRWAASLKTLSGWQYTLRLTLCLAIGGAVSLLWPREHAYWIALTVAIVVQRQMPAALARAFQRTAGTAAGVAFASLFLAFQPPAWSLPLMVVVLAAARPMLRVGNYLAYATAMTPLIILLTELNQSPGPSLLLDRLTATIAGAAIALVFGYLIWPRNRGGSTRT